MSTATNKESNGSAYLSATPSIIANLPDDRPGVLELVEFYELLIKGQLDEYLLLHDKETIRKIKNAVNDCNEGISQLKRAFEEDPTLLRKLREATGKAKGIYCNKCY